MQIKCPTHKKPVSLEFCEVQDCAAECKHYQTAAATEAGKATTVSINGGPEVPMADLFARIDRIVQHAGDSIGPKTLREMVSKGAGLLADNADNLNVAWDSAVDEDGAAVGISVGMTWKIVPHKGILQLDTTLAFVKERVKDKKTTYVDERQGDLPIGEPSSVTLSGQDRTVTLTAETTKKLDSALEKMKHNQ